MCSCWTPESSYEMLYDAQKDFLEENNVIKDSIKLKKGMISLNRLMDFNVCLLIDCRERFNNGFNKTFKTPEEMKDVILRILNEENY